MRKIFLLLAFMPMCLMAQEYYGDVNHDGQIDIVDVTSIALESIGMNDSEEIDKDFYEKSYIDSLFCVFESRLNDADSENKRLQNIIYSQLDKGKSTNIYDYKKATVGVYIASGETGKLAVPSYNLDKFGVSDYIAVNGRDIITNARIGNPIVASICVYDNSKNLVRVISNNRQYTYKEGDAYIRIGFDNYKKGQANYGHTLLAYSEFYEESNDNYEPIYAKIDSLENILNDYICRNNSSNLFNYRTATVGYYIGTGNGKLYEPSYNKDKFGVSDYIAVNGQNIISNARTGTGCASYSVYDKDYNFLRTQENNAQYNYQEGDAYVRICFNNYLLGQANYGTELQEYESYFDSSVDIQKRIYATYGKAAISWIDDDFSYGNGTKNTYDTILDWCLQHRILPDIAFIPNPTSTKEDMRVVKAKEREAQGFKILMHPYHPGWYKDPNGTFVREESKIWENMLDCIRKFSDFGINTAQILVYPGSSGEDLATRQIVSNYVDCGVCWNNKGDTNHLTLNDRYALKRLNIQLSATNTKSEIKQYIKEGVENGDWIILGSHIYHFTVSDKVDETSMTTANLYEILEYADSLCKIRATETVWKERKFMFDIDGK